MKLLDISWPISAAITSYKDRYIVKIEPLKEFEKDGVRESMIELTSHTGTHVDAPAHFLRDGKTIDHVELERFAGSCVVLDLMDVTDAITDERLEEHDGEIADEDIVLFKTTNSLIAATDPFNPHFVYLHESGARYLVEKGVKAVGIDYLGIERGDPSHATHTILLEAGIAIIEGLRLAHVEPGEYPFMCLPLNVIGADAAPARAVLLIE
ncbi:MAG: cyclase family protein [Candidatus Dependentiae bacterium]|nr:cyclase family protein [Candidatus Dependentiae bacterium]